MYTSFTAENFRCFGHLKVEPLERINLIAGKNNTGKTALLEALWLLCGPDLPDLGIRIDSFRGVPAVTGREFLLDLFHNFNSEVQITLSGTGDWGDGSRRLRIKLQRRDTTQILASGARTGEAEQTTAARSATVLNETPNEAVLNYTDELGAEQISRGWLVQEEIAPGMSQEGMRVSRQHLMRRPISVYLPARHREPPQVIAERFGAIEIEGRQDEIVAALKHVEPRLKRLATVVYGRSATIHGDLGTGRLLPVALMGDGMGRLLSMVLAFKTAQDGVVLFDEVENGIHHSIMPKVWRSLAQFARIFNVQVFATTHSYECVRSAHQTFQEDERYDFQLHRLDRVGDEIKAATYDREMLDTALESGLEVR